MMSARVCDQIREPPEEIVCHREEMAPAVGRGPKLNSDLGRDPGLKLNLVLMCPSWTPIQT
jgi:hypothetical protein